MVATSYNWSRARDTAEGSVAVDVLEQMAAERTVKAFLGWQQRCRDWPQAWQEHAGIAGAFNALLMRYVDERPLDDVASRPEGSRAVTFTLFTVPEGEPPPPATSAPATPREA